jgi:glycosyltransferase involved in cell wall biosynthesis
LLSLTGYRRASFWICYLAARSRLIPILFDTDAASFEPREPSAFKRFPLLIGNDRKVKGLDQLLRALELNQDLPFRLLVVGRDEPSLYTTRPRHSKIESRVTFQQPSSDVMQFYAAADAYVDPSLQDSFGLPVLEAMACGLPVISSVRSSVSLHHPWRKRPASSRPRASRRIGGVA